MKRDAATVIARHFPDARALNAGRAWRLPTSLGRVYDTGHAERRLDFRCRTSFAEVLDALREGRELPFVHDPAYLRRKRSYRTFEQASHLRRRRSPGKTGRTLFAAG